MYLDKLGILDDEAQEGATCVRVLRKHVQKPPQQDLTPFGKVLRVLTSPTCVVLPLHQSTDVG